MAFITAISTGTSFEVNKESMFVEDYYKVDLKEKPNYRDINSQSISESLSSQCKTTAFGASGKRVEDGYGYWFVNQITTNINDIVAIAKEHKSSKDNTIQYILFDNIFETYDGYYVILPKSGNITSDFSVSSVHDMTVEIKDGDKTTYVIEITGMKCWYCDISRPGMIDTGESTTQYHTITESTTKDMMSSNVLGVAAKDTKIKVIPKSASKDATKEDILRDFFDVTK